MKIWVIVAPLAGAWMEPTGLLEFCAKMEPRLAEMREEKEQPEDITQRVAALSKLVATVPESLAATPGHPREEGEA